MVSEQTESLGFSFGQHLITETIKQSEIKNGDTNLGEFTTEDVTTTLREVSSDRMLWDLSGGLHYRH